MGCCSSSDDAHRPAGIRTRGQAGIVNRVPPHAIYLASLFKNPIHDEIEKPKFGFQARLARDILQAHPKSIKRLLNVFHQFLVEVSYSLEKNKHPELPIDQLTSRGFYPVTVSLDPFLDLVWREAITYTKTYYKISSLLVGRCLDRNPKGPYFNIKWALRIWPNYTYPMAVYESGYMIWASLDEYYQIVKMLAYHYFTYLEPIRSTRLIQVEDVMSCLNTCLNTFKHQVPNHSGASISQEFNFNLNPVVMNIPVQQKLQEIRQIVYKPKLTQIIQKELNITSDLAALYMEEYCAFLTMMLYSTEELTPSDEIDQVWHTHQGFSYKYRKFCLRIYGRLVTHNPTVGGQVSKDKYDRQYARTLAFYQYLFRKPPSNLWPDIQTRFGGSYEKYCWVSLFRVLSIISSYDKYVPNDSNVDKMLFDYVRINYMNWPSGISDKFEFLKEAVYADVDYNMLSNINRPPLPRKRIPTVQDIEYSRNLAYQLITQKKANIMNQIARSLIPNDITSKNRLYKCDALMYTTNALSIQNLPNFPIKPSKPKDKKNAVTKKDRYNQTQQVYVGDSLDFETYPVAVLNPGDSPNSSIGSIASIGGASSGFGGWDFDDAGHAGDAGYAGCGGDAGNVGCGGDAGNVGCGGDAGDVGGGDAGGGDAGCGGGGCGGGGCGGCGGD